MTEFAQRVAFPGSSGAQLAGSLDLPDGEPRAYALFAHCFTCSKDSHGARRISAELTRAGIAVLRFDFTGLGDSEGEFGVGGFARDIADLEAAAAFLRVAFRAPTILIGHSLGGAAVMAAARRIPETAAVVAIGAPADVAHVKRAFAADLPRIETGGAAEISIAGRAFRISRRFVEEMETARLVETIHAMRLPLLVMHSPRDEIVGVDNAAEIFKAAWHPKSFVSLDTADHMLTRPEDAAFAAQVMAGWLSRYIPADPPQGAAGHDSVQVMETGVSRLQNTVRAGRHRLFADEPISAGGGDTGLSPYDFLAAALGACTSMTLRIYAEFKKIPLGRIRVEVTHRKIHAADCAECADEIKARGGKIDRFERVISVDGDMPPEMEAKIAEIAGKCPVHRTLESSATVVTSVRKP